MTPLKIIAEPGKHVIVMRREFNAPRQRVFRALTDPTLIPRWWGPKDVTTIVDQIELRVGGVWHFTQCDTAGSEYPFFGVYHEISSPARLVYTFEFEGTPGQVMLETITLEEQNGKTLMTDTCVYQSVEHRDQMIQAGMEGGTIDSWDRIDILLAEIS
jgi:uncharacterized protein YndB with AHSA1/START domain